MVFGVGEEGWLGERLRELGTPVHVIPGLGQGRAFEFRSVLALRRLILDSDCALVHAMMFPSHLYACLAARLTGRPCIVNIRNSHHDLVGRRRRLIWRHLIAPLSPFVVTVTEGLADEARRLTRSPRVTCIHNGVDVDRFRPAGNSKSARIHLGIPADAIVIGTVGNLRPVKGHSDLIRAAAMIAQRYPSVRILLIGAELEPTTGDLRRLCRELGLSAQVMFLGRREDATDLLQVMDVFCLPSLSEGMPGALVQAMAAGLPVIVTAVGGNPEVIVDETMGLLVPPQDPIALSQALRKFIEQPELRRRLAERGLARVRTDFSLETMVGRYADLYQALVGVPCCAAEAAQSVGAPTAGDA